MTDSKTPLSNQGRDPRVVVDETAADWVRLGLLGDRAKLADLYTDQAIFFGSLPDIYSGRRGVAAYFQVAPLTALKSVRFDWLEARFIAPTVINAGGLVYFGMELEGETVEWRFGISWVLVKSEARWQIASHHASRRDLPGTE